jgi:hypothetical protein
MGSQDKIILQPVIQASFPKSASDFIFFICITGNRIFVSSMILTIYGPAELFKIIPDDFVIKTTHDPTKIDQSSTP